MLKLNLGSGTSRYQDYLSVDLHTEADLQHDLTTPLPYKDGEVDAIYSSHVIEHFTRSEWEFVRRDWARVIKPGGSIELRCPNITAVAKEIDLAETREQFDLAITHMYGFQAHPGEFHKNGFTSKSLIDSFSDFQWDLLVPSTYYELHMRFTK